MIQTVVSNASAPEYGQATISFPIREGGKIHAQTFLYPRKWMRYEAQNLLRIGAFNAYSIPPEQT